MDIDFIRYNPADSNLEIFGFDAFVIFDENPDKIPDNFTKGYLIKPKSVEDLRKKLVIAKKDWIVGVMSEKPEVNMEAVMRKKVDVVLDFEDRKIDYTTIKLASRKDVIIEICLSKFLNYKGIRRSRIIEETVKVIKIVNKFDAPFVVTSGARNFFEMRQKRQIHEFFSFLGAKIEKSREYALKLYRKYNDPKYIMDGLEILEYMNSMDQK